MLSVLAEVIDKICGESVNILSAVQYQQEHNKSKDIKIRVCNLFCGDAEVSGTIESEPLDLRHKDDRHGSLRAQSTPR